MSSSVPRPIPRSGPSVLGAVLTALGGTVAWHLRHYRRVHTLAQSLRVPLAHDRVVGEGGRALRLVAIGDSVVGGGSVSATRRSRSPVGWPGGRRRGRAPAS